MAFDQIATWTNPGAIVYDPFMGSGTTGKIPHLLARRWLGSEISKEYAAIARQRLQPYFNRLDFEAVT